MRTKRWQDWLNLWLGAWLFVSPWMMNYASELPKAAWNAWIFGAAIVLFGAAAISLPKAWEEAINVLLGMWIAISPSVLKFSSYIDLTTNFVAVGMLVTSLAFWIMAFDLELEKWWGRDEPAI